MQRAKRNLDFFSRKAHTVNLSNLSLPEGEDSLQPTIGYKVKDKELYKLQQVCETPIRLQYAYDYRTSEELIDEFFHYIDNWKEELSDMDTWIEEVDEFIQNVLKKKTMKRKKSIKKTKLSVLHPEDSHLHLTNGDKNLETGVNIKYEGGIFQYGKNNLTEKLI